MAELARGNDEVFVYAGAMRQELMNNAHKGDWNSMKLGESIHELFYHSAKLAMAASYEDGNFHDEAVLEYAADVGNCAMMIADNYGALSVDYITTGHAEQNDAPWKWELPRVKARCRGLASTLVGISVKPRTSTRRAIGAYLRSKVHDVARR